MVMWSTTSKAFWLSTVTNNRGSIVRYVASALVSLIRNPTISIDMPFVNPNWSVDCAKFSASVGRIAYSKSFEMTGVTAIPL
jgi:hypothetical protein